MAEIPFIDDNYIDQTIKSAGAFNPALNKTQGIKLRELIKRLRDRMEQSNTDIVNISGAQRVTGTKSFTQISAEELSFIKNGFASVLRNPLNQSQNYVYTLPKESGEIALLSQLNKSAVGLGNADNTSDADKPVSVATLQALAAKQNALGFIPENVANKAVSLVNPDHSKYPTTQAVAAAINAIALTPGPKGDTGAVGAAGQVGAQGIPGAKGEKGDPGIKGTDGAVGATGASGAQGIPGLTGAKGEKGDPGVKGTDGAVGATGASGAQGIQGFTGAKGEKGDPGVNGTDGAVGATGASGAQGIQGLTGAKGEKGDPGVNGTDGAVGATGATGAQGIQGVAGTDANVPDASDTSKGKLKLAGDLGGTADAPTVPGKVNLNGDNASGTWPIHITGSSNFAALAGKTNVWGDLDGQYNVSGGVQGDGISTLLGKHSNGYVYQFNQVALQKYLGLNAEGETLDSVASRNSSLQRNITLNSANTIFYNDAGNTHAGRADLRLDGVGGVWMHNYIQRYSDGAPIKYGEQWWTGSSYLSVYADTNGFNFNHRLRVSGNSGLSYTQSNIELYSHIDVNGFAPSLSFHYAGVVASQLTIENNGTIAVKNNPGNDYENFTAKSIYATADVKAGYGTNGGFSNVDYQQNHNNIWRLDNAKEYGIGYYQNWHGQGMDYIGFHFGNRGVPFFYVNQSGLVSANQGFMGANYGAGLVGLYDATKYQEVFSMGVAYRSAMDGSSLVNHYGIAWTHSNAGGQSIPGLGHQALFTEAGETQSAVGHGIWTRHHITAYGNITSGASVRGSRVDSDTWFYSTGQSGIYSATYSNGLYPTSVAEWRLYNDSSTEVLLSFSAQGQNNVKGYIHGSASGQFGFLNAGGGWSLRYEPGEAYWHANSFVASNWFRTSGNTGWYSETYGGGIHMVDSTFVRIYNNKSLLIEGGGVYTSGQFVNRGGGGYKSENFHGMVGDYDANGTTDKIIWTIGDNWNTLESMYGLGYQYATKYGTTHAIVFRSAGSVHAAISLDSGNAWFDGTVSAGGDVISFYSDQRLKENLKPLKNALEKVDALSGYTYNSNQLAVDLGAAIDPSVQHVGLMAQDLQAVLPEAVKRAPFDAKEDGTSKSGEDYLTIQYEKVVPLLVEAIKELKAIVMEQSIKIKGLEGQ